MGWSQDAHGVFWAWVLSHRALLPSTGLQRSFSIWSGSDLRWYLDLRFPVQSSDWRPLMVGGPSSFDRWEYTESENQIRDGNGGSMWSSPDFYSSECSTCILLEPQPRLGTPGKSNWTEVQLPKRGETRVTENDEHENRCSAKRRVRAQCTQMPLRMSTWPISVLKVWLGKGKWGQPVVKGFFSWARHR